MRNERGAVTIHVSIALIALLMFLGVVIDQGTFFVARGQVQAAVDAGALAGASSLLIDPADVPNAKVMARYFVNQHGVWGQAVGDANIDVNFPEPCPDGSTTCLRVDAMRGLPGADGTAHTNSWNTFLVRILGPTAQGTRGHAKSQVAAGNAVECIKPWVVADKWTEGDGTTWNQLDSFDPGDTYTPGTSGFTATGTPNDYGLELVLKQGNIGTWSSGWTMEIDLGRTGAAPYGEEIRGCPDWVPTVGLYDSATTTCLVKTDQNEPKGCIGVMTGMTTGPTRAGVNDLVALDSSATWDTGTNSVHGGCMDDGSCANFDGEGINISPRIVPLAIFNPAAYVAGGYTGTNGVAQVVNLLGFFIQGMCDDVYPDAATRPAYCGTNSEAQKAVVGRLMAYPGQHSAGAGPAGPSTFLKFTRLVQ